MKKGLEKMSKEKNRVTPNHDDKNTTIAKERRRQAALERLGTNSPRCIVCGETDWRCLEVHHIAGRKFDASTVILCRNCHRKVSDGQKDHPSQIGTPLDLIEIVGQFLLSLADFFAELIVKLREFGHALIERARANSMTAEMPS